MDDFETFAREKIGRLRAEADALEKVLKEFQAVHARRAGAKRRSGDQPRSGAFGVILEAIAAAGAEGLTLDQMIEAAAAEGYDVKRATLRSQVWQAKNDDLLIPLEQGRYRAPIGALELTSGSVNLDEAPRLVPPARQRFRVAMGLPAQPKTEQIEDEEDETDEDLLEDLDDEIPF
jgi:hypothetical protein